MMASVAKFKMKEAPRLLALERSSKAAGTLQPDTEKYWNTYPSGPDKFEFQYGRWQT